MLNTSCSFPVDASSRNGLGFLHRLFFFFFPVCLDMFSGKDEFLTFAFSLPFPACLTLFTSACNEDGVRNCKPIAPEWLLETCEAH